MRRFLDGDEPDDPMLSLVNIIDVFLVIVAVLLITVVQSPDVPLGSERTDAAESPVRITVDDGEELREYRASEEIGEGEGVRAGTTYRLSDGRLIYVPETP